VENLSRDIDQDEKAQKLLIFIKLPDFPLKPAEGFGQNEGKKMNVDEVTRELEREKYEIETERSLQKVE
jgi:hypothetical protein